MVCLFIQVESKEWARLRIKGLHNQAAAALLVLVVHLVAIALALLRISVGAVLGLAVRLLVEAANLSYQVVEGLVHVDPLLGRCLDQSRVELLGKLTSLCY